MQKFIDQLKELLKGPLPGSSAHIKMSPAGRGNTEEHIKSLLIPAKISAVMILLFNEEDITKMVLIKRPNYQGIHSGQISLPGGKFEESDNSYQQTAFRETEEEIGVTANQIEFIGGLSRIYIPPSNFVVYPFVGFCKQKPLLKIDSKEVEDLILLPIDILLDESIKDEGIFMTGGESNWQVKAPYFNIENQKIWGATAAILSEFKELLTVTKLPSA